VKTIKNSKSKREFALACVLILTILLSSMGIIAAKRPDKPGDKISKTWDIKIFVGLKDLNGDPIEDVVLDAPEYLFAEDVPSSGVGGGLWDQPMKKGGRPNKNNYLAAQVNLYKDDDDICGAYLLADAEGHDNNSQPSSLGDFSLENDDIDYVSIQHHVWPMGEGMDYWTFVIRWFLIINPDPIEYGFYELMTWTNKDYEPEGTLSEEEGWTILFNEANAMLFSSWIDEDPNDGLPDNYHWMGSLDFTVQITRTLHEA
jgi:hypothetical protein